METSYHHKQWEYKYYVVCENEMKFSMKVESHACMHYLVVLALLTVLLQVSSFLLLASETIYLCA